VLRRRSRPSNFTPTTTAYLECILDDSLGLLWIPAGFFLMVFIVAALFLTI
jgi:hypothetical protein